MEIWHILIGQALQLVATVAVLKTDNQWLKSEVKRVADSTQDDIERVERQLAGHDKRIRHVEIKIGA